MYDDYFGLKQPPFKITPDTSLFYPGGDRGAILEALVYAVMKGEGIVKVVGEVGSGKTMLCRMLEAELPNSVEIVYLANPSLSPENILHAIAFELELPIRPDSSRLQVMNLLQEYLLQRHASGRQVVVFVEEAQSMPVATLEEIRLLSNLETQQYKLLQIVLFGQPELDQMIARPEIRQLKERITYSFLLNPFRYDDIKDYINSRLRSCGHRSGEVFTNPAVKAIGHYSRGLVRRINILADKSLLAAYALNHHQVTEKHVKQAARDSEYSARIQYWLWGAVIMVCLLIVTGAVVFRQLPGINQIAAEAVSTDEVNERVDEPEPEEGEPKPEREGAVDADFNGELGAPDGPQARLLDISELLEGSVAGTIGRADSDFGVVKSGNRGNSGEVDAGLVPANRSGQQQGEPQFNVSEQEMRDFRKQLQLLPPEVAYTDDSSAGENVCKLCWSIIYRPMINYEKL